jgi:hypothetical protein
MGSVSSWNRTNKIRVVLFLVVLLIMPGLLLFEVLNYAGYEYSLGVNPQQLIPSPVQSENSTYPYIGGNVFLTLNVSSLQNSMNSRFELVVNARFHTIASESTPWLAWATECTSTQCGTLQVSEGLPNPTDDITSAKESYKGWRVYGGTNNTPFDTFSPYTFPFDTYSTPTYYFAMNKSLASAFWLQTNAPAPFIAIFQDVKQNLQSNVIPSGILNSPVINSPSFASAYRDLLKNGFVVSFRISLIRSPDNLITSTLYTIFPVLIIYEVCFLSLLSLSEENRLAVYVGILFSVFAYFFTLRQFLPTYPTFIEAIVTLGMTCWILFEGVRFVAKQISDKQVREWASLAVIGLSGLLLIWRGLLLFANPREPFVICTMPLNNADTIGNFYRSLVCTGWITQFSLLVLGLFVLLGGAILVFRVCLKTKGLLSQPKTSITKS